MSAVRDSRSRDQDPAAPAHSETVIGGRVFRWGSRTYLMGVVNVTPDSFSGDGIAGDPSAAADLAECMAAEGRRPHRRGRRVDPPRGRAR